MHLVSLYAVAHSTVELHTQQHSLVLKTPQIFYSDLFSVLPNFVSVFFKYWDFLIISVYDFCRHGNYGHWAEQWSLLTPHYLTNLE
jgi:hypothetical protein